MDPMTLFIAGSAFIAWKEWNKRDYGVLTPSRDERYRNAMEYCHQPEQLLAEAKLFSDYGLKAQAAMLKRRAEWRSRTDDVKKAHEDIYQKALTSKNIPAILEVALAFEGWTATKKAECLRQRVQDLQEQALQEAVQSAAAAATTEVPEVIEAQEVVKTQKKSRKNNGINHTEAFTGVIDNEVAVGDDT